MHQPRKRRLVIYCGEETYRKFKVVAAPFHAYEDFLKLILDNLINADLTGTEILVLKTGGETRKLLEEALREAQKKGIDVDEALAEMARSLLDQLRRGGYFF